jgi:phosphopentomutase
MGVVPAAPLPTYPKRLSARRRRTLERSPGCASAPTSRPSGTEVIEEWGQHHLRTGEVILYTSADSVLQLAAHHDVLSEDDLVAACAAARDVMTVEHAVGRVSRGRSTGEPGAFRRTWAARTSPAPAGRSYLEELQDAGVPCTRRQGPRPVRRVGIDRKHPARRTRRHRGDDALLRELDAGLVFVNLVETDQVYGHRHDVEGFHAALRRSTTAVAEWLGLLRDDDLLVLDRRPRRRPARAAHRPHARARARCSRVSPAGRAAATTAARRRRGQRP